MSVMKEITLVISIHSVTTQWGALSVTVMMGSWEMELTVMVSSYGKCGKRLFKQCLISPIQTSMSVSKITLVISMHSVTTQLGALNVAVMMGSWEMELTVMVSCVCN